MRYHAARFRCDKEKHIEVGFEIQVFLFLGCSGMPQSRVGFRLWEQRAITICITTEGTEEKLEAGSFLLIRISGWEFDNHYAAIEFNFLQFILNDLLCIFSIESAGAGSKQGESHG